MSVESYRFKVGAFECLAAQDFIKPYSASRLFTNAPR
jgi:hypothetical protein